MVRIEELLQALETAGDRAIDKMPKRGRPRKERREPSPMELRGKRKSDIRRAIVERYAADVREGRPIQYIEPDVRRQTEAMRRFLHFIETGERLPQKRG